jgi:hypothetical protein
VNIAVDPAVNVGRECIISGLVNALIGLGFFLALFGLSEPVGVWGIGNYVFDFLPQGFAVAFFGSFVPSILASRAVRNRGIASDFRDMPTIAAFLRTSVMKGVVASLVGTALFAGLFWLIGLQELDVIPALSTKLAYGALLGGSVTFLSLRRLVG